MKSLDEVRALMAARRQAGETESNGVSGAGVARSGHARPERPPLSAAQRSVWAHQQLDPSSTAYNLCLLMTFTADDGADALDSSAVVEAFRTMVRRHEALRTTYPVGSDGEPWQCVHDDLEPEVRFHDHGDAQTVALSAAARPFDLATESPLRLDVVQPDGRTVHVVVTVQHIIWDGMTMAVLAREVGAAYRGCTGELPHLDMQVADFAVQESARSTQSPAADCEDHDQWAEVFRDGVPQLALTVDGDPHAAPGAGGRVDRVLSAESDRNLRRLAEELRVSPFTVFVAAYHVVLRLTTGHHRTVIGTTVANREQPGQELLFGNFSNQVPLLVDSGAASDSGGMTFGEFVAGGTSGGVARVISQAFRHKLMPATEISVAAGVDRASGEELCGTMVLFLTRDIAGPQLPGVQTSWELIDNGGALYPLAVEAFHHSDRTEIQLTYRRDSLSAEAVSSMADMLDTVLATARPSTLIDDLLGPGRMDRAFLDQYGVGPRRSGVPETVDAMIRAAVAVDPDHPAVTICGPGGETLSYAEYDARVNRVTRELLARGVATGDRVLVVTGRDPVLPVVMAAVLRAGAVYVPVDPTYPERRIREIADDAAPSLVVCAGDAPRLGTTEHRHAEDLYAGVPIVDLDDADTAAAIGQRDGGCVDTAELTRPLTGSDGCYMIYTSGSTGRPKGVLNHHRGVANHLQWYGSTFLGGRPARVLHKAPVTFDVGVAEILNPLATGGTAVVPPAQWWEGDAQALAEMVEDQRIEVLSLVPSYLRVILDTVDRPSRMACLERVLLGGEAVPGGLAAQARDIFDCRVFSLYGPTEAAMDVTCVEFTPDLVVGDGETLIGVPEDNTTVRVIDADGREVPVGVPGELCVVGVQVADGYRNLPEQTAEVFGTSPFPADRGERMYRTGDVVQWRRDGVLRYLGRSHDQVKIRGNRVELSEVEAALCDVPGVRHAAARAWVSGHSTRLVGYVVSDGHTVIDQMTAAGVMRRRVPDYMVPDTVISLGELPLNVNGKLDRSRLPEPTVEASNGGASEAPATGGEAVVAEVIADVLSLDRVPGQEDDLFSLGGDSITAIRVVAELRNRGYQASSRDVLDARTIAGIASVIEGGEESGLVEEPPVTSAPLPPIARALLSGQSDGGGLVQYTVLAVPGETTTDEVASRLQRLVRRHPVLAAQLDPASAELVIPSPDQVRQLAPPVVDDEPEASLSGDGVIVRERARRLAGRIDPLRGQMVAAGLVGQGSGRALIVVVSHVVVDGVSWRLITGELADDSNDDRNPEYAFPRWSVALSKGVDGDTAWEEIARAAAGQCVLDPARDVESTVHELHTTVDADVSGLVVAAAERSGCGVLDVQIAAAVRALRAERGDATSAVTGVTLEGHGRDNPDAIAAHAEDAVGWFTAAYPLAVESGAPDAESPLATVHAVRAARQSLPADTARPGMLRAAGRITAALPELTVNYLGRFAVGDPARGVDEQSWRPVPGLPAVSGLAGPEAPVGSVFDLTTDLTIDGESTGEAPTYQLHAMLRVAGRHVDYSAAEAFMECWTRELRAVADAAAQAPGPAPVDLTADGVTSADVVAWADQLGQHVEDVLPLTPLQSGLMLSSLSTGGTDGYIVQSVLEVEDPHGVVNATMVGDAATIVTRHHPSLRLAPLATRGGVPVGVVTAGSCVPAVEVDLTGDNGAAAVDRWLSEDIEVPFDLHRPPLMRIALLRTGATSRTIVLTCHHLLTDGWTGQLLMVELARVLADLVRGDASGVARHVTGDPATFGHAAQLIARQASATREAWKPVLEGVEPRLLAPGHHGGHPPAQILTAEISEETTNALTNLAGSAEATLTVVCQVAWAHALNQVTGGDRAVFGEVVSGRTVDVPGVEESIGCYTNTVPSTVSVPAERTWRATVTALAHHRRTVSGREHLPLPEAHRLAGVRRLFDTLYVFQSYPARDTDLRQALGDAGLELTGVRPGGATDSPVMLMVFPSGSVMDGDGLRLVLYAAPDVMDSEEARIVLDALTATLRAMASNPDGVVGDARVIDEFDEMLLEPLRTVI